MNTDTIEALRTATKALAWVAYIHARNVDPHAGEGYMCDVAAINDFTRDELLDYINAVVADINETTGRHRQ